MPFLFPNKLLNEGMRSAVSCQILEGSLPITFRWDKDGHRLGGGAVDRGGDLFAEAAVVDGVVIRSNDEYSSTLIIDHLQFVHRGNYTCLASNAAGTAAHSAELTVNGNDDTIILSKFPFQTSSSTFQSSPQVAPRASRCSCRPRTGRGAQLRGRRVPTTNNALDSRQR